jgi:hypothetical protein
MPCEAYKTIPRRISDENLIRKSTIPCILICRRQVAALATAGRAASVS